MNKFIKITVAAAFTASMALLNVGCHSTDQRSHSSGTHRMGTPKENYRMSNEDMPDRRAKPRRAGRPTDGSGTHRMGTPKENYRMSNEDMRR